MDEVKLQKRQLLAKSIRQQQMAKPRTERNLLLASRDDELNKTTPQRNPGVGGLLSQS
ncbi:hypothetical protein DPMN_184108 [Dreissena polymorpha]|uniref:Uncharacterized protein n=1 Tax=Dreissena polymorpha TaxID=45954 RepID=A0A9D4I7K4_DREPO|nr:hypothetical protein DPMN_184108 [Dreissena polymorpha]